MAKYNFEGDLDGISERQLQFINDVIEEYGFKGRKVTFEPVGKAGDNYVASVKRITIDGDNETMTMVGKMAPTSEVMRNFMNSGTLFKNEHLMYTEFLPKLVELQKNAGISEENYLKYAKCYGSFAEAPNEVILLEDLKPLNFSMIDKFQPFSNEYVKSVLKNIALYHSLCHVLKHEEPETYENFKENLTEIWSVLAEGEEQQILFQQLEDDTLSILEDPDHVNLMKHLIVDTFKTLVQLLKTDYEKKYSVIVQGDAWTNNIMFKFENGELVESIIIDYQMSRNCSPVYDIMYMIFNGTDYETRKEFYHQWIDYYYSEVENCLNKFNLECDTVYPRNQLDADLKRYGRAVLGICVVIANMLVRKADDAAKLLDVVQSENKVEESAQYSISQLDEESINRFKDRIINLIKSFKEFELL